MLEMLIFVFIYPFKFSFYVEGLAEQNLSLLNRFIDEKSFIKVADSKEKITFRFLVSRIIGGWGLNAAYCSLVRINKNRCKMTFNLYILRNLVLPPEHLKICEAPRRVGPSTSPQVTLSSGGNFLRSLGPIIYSTLFFSMRALLQSLPFRVPSALI